MRAASRAVLATLGLAACAATPIQRATEPPSASAVADGAGAPTATADEPRAPTPAVDEASATTTSAEPSASAATSAALDEATVARARIFADAHRALREGRRDDARRAFAASVQRVPELADHALLHEARLARDAGDADQARAALDRLLSEHPDSVWLAAAAVDRGALALDAGETDHAVALFSRALDADDASTTDAARLGLARAEHARGRAARAFVLVDPLRGKPGALGNGARELGEQLEALGAERLEIPPDELQLRAARARLREGRSADARAALAPLLREGHPLRAEAALVEARSWGKASPAEAAAAYEIAIRTSSAADVAGTALFERGKAAWNRDEDDVADADFRALLERFPDHQGAPEALAARARIADARGDTARAIALHEQVASRYPGNRFAADSAWRAAFLRYQSGDASGAVAAFAALGAGDDARYWQARALAKAGDEDAARALLATLRERAPASYFAWWADERLGRPRTRPDFPRAGAPTAVAPPALGGAAAEHLTRARLLVAIGLPREAVREYAAVERASGPDPFLVTSYRDAGAWSAAVRAAIRLQQSRPREVRQEFLYPRAFSDEVMRAASRAGVDPLLLLAIARQESLFDPDATSPAGARGLLQLMPATASQVAGRPVDSASLADPGFNAELAAQHLSALLARYDGRLVLVIAAYNAGADAVERWIARAGDAPGDEFVERISYRETRDYVKTVLRNYRTYRLLYGPDAPPRARLY